VANQGLSISDLVHMMFGSENGGTQSKIAAARWEARQGEAGAG
jgi:hypothetical protein